MMRPMLQFVGFASSAVWALLMVGTIFSTSANADTTPYTQISCQNCYSCTATSDCVFANLARGCVNTGKSCMCMPKTGGVLR